MDQNHHLSEHVSKIYGLSTGLMSKGIVTVDISIEKLVDFISSLKQDEVINMESMLSICCVDYPSREKRFELIYNFINYTTNTRLVVKLQVSDRELVPSISSVFPNAIWYEREAWDMYGVLFSNHPDMRRILTDYGFVGHPMRKEFPLTGYIEVYYNERNVFQKNIQLDQDFRLFDFQNTYEGAKHSLLPGDEKANR